MYLVLLENGQIVSTESGYMINEGDIIETAADAISTVSTILYVGSDKRETDFIKAVYGEEFVTDAKKIKYEIL